MRRKSISRIVDSFSLEFILDVTLHKNNRFLYPVHRCQHIQLELQLIEQLTISIRILYYTKWLCIVHLVLLNLLNLVFLVFVKHKSLELRYILLQNIDVGHPRVEMRRNKLLEVVQMHEVRIYALKHLLIEIYLQHVFILLTISDHRRIQRLQRSSSR